MATKPSRLGLGMPPLRRPRPTEPVEAHRPQLTIVHKNDTRYEVNFLHFETFEDLPSPGEVEAGVLVVVTTTGDVYKCDGTTWQNFAAPSSREQDLHDIQARRAWVEAVTPGEPQERSSKNKEPKPKETKKFSLTGKRFIKRRKKKEA